MPDGDHRTPEPYSSNARKLRASCASDTNFIDVVRMVGAIAMVPTEDGAQKQRLLELALDGLRYRP